MPLWITLTSMQLKFVWSAEVKTIPPPPRWIPEFCEACSMQVAVASPIGAHGSQSKARGAVGTTQWCEEKLSGDIEFPIFWGIKQCNSMVVLRDFPLWYCIVWVGNLITLAHESSSPTFPIFRPKSRLWYDKKDEKSHVRLKDNSF